MLGFMPGFPYLGGLPARIATPRLSVSADGRPGRVGGHRRGADRHLSRREPRGMAAHRAHPGCAVRHAQVAAHAARSRRPRALRADHSGRLLTRSRARWPPTAIVRPCGRGAPAGDRHRGPRRRPADHGAGPRALRRPAVRRAGVGGDGRLGAARGEPAGRQRRGRRGPRDHAGGARAALRRTRGDCRDRRRPRRVPRRTADAVVAGCRRGSRRRVVVFRRAGWPARLSWRRRRHRRAAGARQPLDAADGAARRLHGQRA